MSPEALRRALRSTATASGSLSAAELGQRIATALSTIETAVLAIDAVTERLREAADLVADAGRSADIGRRALLADRYDDLRAEIDAIVGSASHNRINLISGRRIGGQYTSFQIALDGDDRAGVSIPVVNLTTGPGGLSFRRRAAPSPRMTKSNRLPPSWPRHACLPPAAPTASPIMRR